MPEEMFIPCQCDMSAAGSAHECVVFTETDILLVCFTLEGKVVVEVC